MSNLGYRIVTDSDLPLLLRYRQECGWGEEAVKKNWNDPDRIYCVFESVVEGEKQDVGMGCWYLHQPDDLELACRDTDVVHIASLFIPVKYQGSGTGTKALQLLERVSVERFGAKVVTLDTLAHVIIESECKTYHLEDTNVPSRNVGWYGRKGYTKFRANGPLYPLPTPADPDRKLTAVFMSKSADAILAEMHA